MIVTAIFIIFCLSEVSAVTDLPLGGYYCYLRCTASCMDNRSLNYTLNTCQEHCQRFNDDNLCVTADCWKTCNDFGMGEGERPPIPVRVRIEQSGQTRFTIQWTSPPDIPLFFIQFKPQSETNWTSLVTTKSSHQMEREEYCSGYSIRIGSVRGNGVSRLVETETAIPVPRLRPQLQLLDLYLVNQPFLYYMYNDSATVILKLKYQLAHDWPLGVNDIELKVLGHNMRCKKSFLGTALPDPIFEHVASQQVIIAKMPSKVMQLLCSYLFKIDMIGSRQCKTEAQLENTDLMTVVDINCNKTRNSGCALTPEIKRPVCGQQINVTYEVLSDTREYDTNDELSVKVHFDLAPFTDRWLYAIVYYGNATEYSHNAQNSIIPGVSLLKGAKNISTCPDNPAPIDGSCIGQSNSTEVVLEGLKMDRLYGLRVCLVMDRRNLAFPSVDPGQQKNNIIRNDRILIASKDYMANPAAMIAGIVLGCMLAFVLLFIVIVCCVWKRNVRKQKRLCEWTLNRMKEDYETRYTDLPRKNDDIWELERRNLVIQTEKKLGSGAFGAVYLGRIIGKIAAHKDANSTLGVNLMRAENAHVAVKMLPEYADELSKSEFLKEINLMKSLGYHERMVNMLACVTDSEPYCLVVEYCSDGDLLHFLRHRCNYMMKLDELNIDYKNPKEDDQFDPDMVVTLKQLLMFAVQISYGLEYLSQKGFIHRDVAARNVLVHEKTEAKIGDFGLCRYIYSENANYKSKGGRLPIKWMSPEAIRYYEFSTKSDVWSFGVLMFEIITLGGSPYPGLQPDDVQEYLEKANRMDKPDNCPTDFYEVMKHCWEWDPCDRLEFSEIRQKLAAQLEEVTEAYSYLKLNAARDYYNVDNDTDEIKQNRTDTVEVDDKGKEDFDTEQPCHSVSNNTWPENAQNEVYEMEQLSGGDFEKRKLGKTGSSASDQWLIGPSEKKHKIPPFSPTNTVTIDSSHY